MQRLLLLTLCSVLTLQSAWAETTAPANPDTLVVDIKANKPKKSPNIANVKQGETSRVLPADGGEFLKQLNGVSGSRFGGRGIEPIVRGQSQTQLNVLLDGAYVHGGCPNRMDPPTSYAALETYEKVTVQKGVQSLQHGSGGSGGTILFERDTRGLVDSTDGWSGRVSATTMNNGIKHDISADVTRGNDKGYVRVFAQDRAAGNYEDGDGKEVRSSYKHRQGGLVVGVTPTADSTLEYSYENNDFSDALYSGAGMDSPTEKADIHRIKYQDRFNGTVKKIDSDLYVSNVEHVMDNYSLRPQAGTKMSVPTTSDTVGGKLALTSTLNAKTDLTYGVNVQNRERTATLKNISMNKDMALSWPAAETKQTGIFAEAETKATAKDTLKYGVRIDSVNADATRANEAFNGKTAQQAYQKVYGSTYDGKTKTDETNVGGLLRYERALNANTTVFTGLSRTVRTADETERYINNSGWTGNPDLKPEKHHQLDLGLTQQHGKTRWTGTVYADKVNDFILRDRQSPTQQIYRNVDAKLYGIELGAERKLTDKLKLSGDMAYVRRTNTTDDRNIAQTPPLLGKAQLDYNGTKWGSGARIRFASGQKNVDMLSPLEVGESSGYGVMDAYGRYNLTKASRVRFGLDNVFDKTYAEHVSRRNNDITNDVIRVNEAGRTAWLKLETEF